MRYYFRFDDVSVNTDQGKIFKMTQLLYELFGVQCEVIYAVSLAVHDRNGAEGLAAERVFPSILHTESDYRCFYRVKRVGLPLLADFGPNEVRKPVIASHGLVHVDHRLLSRTAQELSIVMSCSILNSRTFVPPFHKWNEKTERVCRENDIHLTKYDEGWKHLLYHKFDISHERYYLHTHDFDFDSFRAQFPRRVDRYEGNQQRQRFQQGRSD